MPITKGNVQEVLQDALKTLFFMALEAETDNQYQRIVTIAPSGDGRDGEKYGWLGPTKGMREFKDRRVPQGLVAHDYTIKNKKWEDTLAIEREVIDADQYGQVKLRVQSLAQQAARFKGKLVLQTLAAGATNKCYDGKYFFDTTHQEPNNPKSPVQSNKLTDALSKSSLIAAILLMEGFKDENGELLGIIPDMLVVPPALQFTARELLESVYYPGEGTTTANLAKNTLQGIVDLQVNPYLTDSSDWFLLCTKGVIKPLILQQSDAVELRSLEAASEIGFMTDCYTYGVRERFNVGYGLWQNAVGSIVT
ncbi:MAG: Mu-like prophage major head subunit gpT family protein [Armatimonadota bacterium]